MAKWEWESFSQALSTPTKPTHEGEETGGEAEDDGLEYVRQER